MKDIIRSILGLLLVALVLAIVVPFAIMGWRLAETWTTDLTGQLLGGCIAIGAFAAAIIATMAGAGAFARLAGWQAPRYHDDPPPVVIMPPEEQHLLPPGSNMPPWGMTGGGQFDLLPPPQQDPRYTMETERRSANPGQPKVDTLARPPAGGSNKARPAVLRTPPAPLRRSAVSPTQPPRGTIPHARLPQ